MEILPPTPIVSSLKSLEKNSLFPFLKNVQPELVQHDLIRETFVLGEGHPRIGLSVFAETLASDVSRKLNEDSILILPIGRGRLLFAVLDGASSQRGISGLETHHISGAFYISHLVALGFRDSSDYEKLSRQETLTAGDVMVAVNKWVLKEMQKVPGVDYNDVLTVPGMAATFLLVDPKGEITLAHVADTVAAAFYENDSIKVLTSNQNEKFDKETMELIEKLAREYKCNLAQVHRIPEAKARLKTHLQESFRRKINKSDGCGILNGMPELTRNKLVFERKIEISEDLSSILLLSDGAILPYSGAGISLESAVRQLAEKVRGKLNGSVLESGAARLANDPDFKMIPRQKDRDDATIIEISLNKR